METEGQRSNSTVRRPGFSQEESHVLVREVQSRAGRIYGTAGRAPRTDDAKAAWEEVRAIVDAVCPDKLRTVAQCKKRLNDIRRKAKMKLSERRAADGGPSTSSTQLSSAEEIASSTLFSLSVEGFGGFEVGNTAAAPQATPPLQQHEEEEEEEWDEEEEDGEEEKEAVQSPRSRPRVEDRDQPFLDIQEEGFSMLQRELGALHRIEERLRSLQDWIGPLTSIDASLRRLADAADRLVPQTSTATAPHSPR